MPVSPTHSLTYGIKHSRSKPIVESPIADNIDWGNPIDFDHPHMDGCVGLWPFFLCESPLVAIDLTGRHRLEVDQGSSPPVVQGIDKFNRAWTPYYNGTSPHDDNSFLKTAYTFAGLPITCVGWFKKTSHIGTNISGITSGTSANSVIDLQHSWGTAPGDEYLTGRVHAPPTSNKLLKSPSTLADNVWYHGVFVVGSNDDRRLYLDGVLVASNGDTIDAPTGIDTINVGLVIYNSARYGGDGASLSESRLYEKALDDQEVWSLFDSSFEEYNVTTGRVSWYVGGSLPTTSPPNLVIPIRLVHFSDISQVNWNLKIEITTLDDPTFSQPFVDSDTIDATKRDEWVYRADERGEPGDLNVVGPSGIPTQLANAMNDDDRVATAFFIPPSGELDLFDSGKSYLVRSSQSPDGGVTWGDWLEGPYVVSS